MSVIEDYAAGLEAAASRATIRLLAEGTVFQSPFSVWESRDDVAAAMRARSTAFSGVRVLDVATSDTGACLRWVATLNDQPVEGCESLAVTDDRITRVDVFLRPAAVLSTVFAAMQAAWPAS